MLNIISQVMVYLSKYQGPALISCGWLEGLDFQKLSRVYNHEDLPGKLSIKTLTW